jgi:hypothetical protein
MKHPDNPSNPVITLNEKMEKYKNECGCKLGAKFMAAGFVLSLIFFIYQDSLISLKFLIHLPFIAAITIGAAGIGKITGILFAKLRYKQVSGQLMKYLTNLKMEETNYAGNMEEN